METTTRRLESPTSRTRSSETDSLIEQRGLRRAQAERRRRRLRLITLGTALLPVALAIVYLLFLVSPQYVAESRFTVQAAQTASSSSSSSPMTSLLSGGGGGLSSMASGFVDGWAVQDFLNSRDCMLQLDKKVNLRRYLAKPNLDPFNHLGPKPTEDALFRAYQKVVHSSYNMIEQINVMKVDGFSPHDSTFLSVQLMTVVEDFVNRMNQQGIDDALKVSRQSVQMAEQQDRNALSAISQWRGQHGNVDPNADASMLLSQVGLVESSLSAAQVNLDKIEALRNPDHPMLQPARAQVNALTERLGQLRARMSGQNDNTSAVMLKTYIQLTNEQTFADNNLLAARQSYQQANTSALGLQRYLSIIAKPVPESQPSIPNPYVLLLISLALGCGLALALNLGLSLYQSFRHG